MLELEMKAGWKDHLWSAVPDVCF